MECVSYQPRKTHLCQLIWCWNSVQLKTNPQNHGELTACLTSAGCGDRLLVGEREPELLPGLVGASAARSCHTFSPCPAFLPTPASLPASDAIRSCNIVTRIQLTGYGECSSGSFIVWSKWHQADITVPTFKTELEPFLCMSLTKPMLLLWHKVHGYITR